MPFLDLCLETGEHILPEKALTTLLIGLQTNTATVRFTRYCAAFFGSLPYSLLQRLMSGCSLCIEYRQVAARLCTEIIAKGLQPLYRNNSQVTEAYALKKQPSGCSLCTEIITKWLQPMH
jgi:hypothetical protein